MSSKSLLVLNANVFDAYKKLFLDNKNIKNKNFNTHKEKMNHFDLDFPNVAINEYIDHGYKYEYRVAYHGLRSCYTNIKLINFITYCEFIITTYIKLLKREDKIICKLINDIDYDTEDIIKCLTTISPIIYGYCVINNEKDISDDRYSVYTLLFYIYFYTRYRNSFSMAHIINNTYDKMVNYIFYNVINNNIDLDDIRSYKSFFKSIRYKVFYKTKIQSFIDYMNKIFIPTCVRAFE